MANVSKMAPEIFECSTKWLRRLSNLTSVSHLAPKVKGCSAKRPHRPSKANRVFCAPPDALHPGTRGEGISETWLFSDCSARCFCRTLPETARSFVLQGGLRGVSSSQKEHEAGCRHEDHGIRRGPPRKATAKSLLCFARWPERRLK